MPPRPPTSRPPVTEPIRSACSSCARRPARTVGSSSVSAAAGSTTSAEIDTDCTSPEPVTTTVTLPPPAEPSTVVAASSSCAVAMSACIFCIWRIIWLSCFWFAMLVAPLAVPLVALAAARSVVLAFLDDRGAQRLGEKRRRVRLRLYSGLHLDRFPLDHVVGLAPGRGRGGVVRSCRRDRAGEALVRDEIEAQVAS